MKRLPLIVFLLMFLGLGAATAGYVFVQLGGSGAAPVGAETDEYESLDFHPFTLDPLNFDCPESDHFYRSANYRNCDPINVIFEDMGVVEASWALQNSGWTVYGIGTLQYLHLDNQDWPLVQSAQLFRRFASGSGPCDDDARMCRYHVRLWDVPDGRGVVAAVHFEDGRLLDHDLRESWEFAERKLCTDLDALPRYECVLDTVELDAQEDIQDGSTWRSNPGFAGTNNQRASLVRRDPIDWQ